MWEAQEGNVQLIGLFMLAMLIVQEKTTFIQDEITMLEEISFIFRGQ